MQREFQSLSLFGLDLAPWIQRWRAGWHSLFWGDDTGLRQRLEAPVALAAVDGRPVQWFVAERPLAEAPSADCPCHRACLMPGESILLCEVVLPDTVEAELDAVMQLEAHANSPFAAEDTCHGWFLRRRGDGQLYLTLAITAVSEVMATLHQRDEPHAAPEDLPEVWCLDADGRPIVLRGFGETRRAADYRRRLAWLGGLAGLALLLCCALMLVPGLVRAMQADNMAYHYAQAQAEASEAMRLREELALDNSRADALREMLEHEHDYAHLLDALTAGAPDSVYLEQLGIEGNTLRLRGWASNAAAYMQALTENPDYAEVRAPSAFRRHGRTGLEQFVLELELQEAAP